MNILREVLKRNKIIASMIVINALILIFGSSILLPTIALGCFLIALGADYWELEKVEMKRQWEVEIERRRKDQND